MLPDDVAGPIWTSGETKADDTARAIANVRGLDVATDERFGEVVRPWSDGDYAAIARQYLCGVVVDGWEPASTVRARFASAVEDVRREGTVVIVDHGLAMSLYVASVTEIDVVAFWTSLRFPDAWLLDGALTRLFDEGRRAPGQT